MVRYTAVSGDADDLEVLDVEGSPGAQPALITRLSRAFKAAIRSVQHGGFEPLPQQEEDADREEGKGTAGLRGGLRWCPEDEAGLLSNLSYSFVSSLIRLGFQKPLLQDDLWDVSPRDQAVNVCGRFQGILDSSRDPIYYPKGSVLRAMWRAHRDIFFLTGAIKLLDIALLLTPPLLLERLLDILQADDGSTGMAFVLALAMYVVGLSEMLVNNRQMHLSMRMCMHLKSQMIGMLYRKSLKVHSAARGEFGTGAIINLQSNDAQKLWWMPLFMHFIWSAPLQILIVCGLLVRVMGLWPSIAGLSMTFLLIPASSLVGKRLAKARKEVVTATDARVKMTTEVILGIRAIKLYAWETPFVDRITNLRSIELEHIRQAAIYNALNTVLFLGGPIFISLAAFMVYGLLGYQLTAAVAFPTLALFNLLRFPLMILPEQILNIIQGRVALNRVQNFQNAEEMDQHPRLPAAKEGDIAVQIQHGNFSWEAGGRAILQDIDFAAKRGMLVMIVGEVGSGKSSFLAAVLSEMTPGPSTSVTLAGSVAYTAQDPWIRNVSLRENILMGSPYDAAKYQAVLEACALNPDIAILAGGDAAEIGEKGINLSGGQRARVALARACYAAADVYLLDDPLSAVDAHVGQHLFERCVRGLLQASTRILVTHQLQFLPAADLILVLSGGRIQHSGTYMDLTRAGVEFRQFALEESSSEDEADKALPDVAEELTRGLRAGASEADGSGAETSAADLPWQGHAEECEAAGLLAAGEAPQEAARLSSASAALAEMSPEQSSSAYTNGFQEHSDKRLPLKHCANSMDLGSELVRTTTGAFDQIRTSSEDAELANGREGAASATSNGHRSSRYTSSSLEPVLERTVSIALSTATSMGSQGIFVHAHKRRPSGERRRSSDKGRRRSSDHERTRAKEGSEHRGASFGKIVEKEERAVGRVETRMYKAYLEAWSPWFWLPLAMMLTAAGERGLQVGQNFWLSVWTDATTAAETRGQGPLQNSFYLSVYFALGSASIVLQAGRLIMLVVGSINATRVLHAGLLNKVVRLPMSFFDSQPTGRLLNRFARDTESVDTKVPQALGSFLNCLVNVLGSLILIVGVTPSVVCAIVPLWFIYELVRRRYVATVREVKRLDSLAMSPIFSMFSETLQGLPSVRAYRLQGMFGTKHNQLLDGSSRCWWPMVCVNRWLSVRLELIGQTSVFCTAATAAIILPRSAGLAGLAITAALNLTGLMNWTVRQSTELEVQMNSVERIMAYTNDFPAERPAIVPNRRPPSDWPSQGAITLQKLVVTHRADLLPVLKGLDLEIRGHEKVGIAGRTGCGKSTLMMALYRIVEPASGRIIIDGLDVSEMGLFDLRSRLALVPQDPVVFSGSVRDNLDPFNTAGGDALLWQALARSGLQQAISDLPGGLDADMAEGGGNLSAGQRQLLCMARALLKQARIMVLDEATSSVDSSTDQIIQGTVRSAFAECTVLTVAHRLHTISDCDRILVLDAGTVREFDSPSNLLKDPSSAFYALVAETTKQTLGDNTH